MAQHSGCPTGIPREPIESELFGHEAGAMPAELQAKLLRVLQGGAVRRVGGTAEAAVDVRVIAATHRDIPALVEAGRFREDLCYRLEAFTLELRPLREREDDLERLALYFLKQHAARLHRNVDGIDRTALAALRAYPFPGNVRELSNTRVLDRVNGNKRRAAAILGITRGTLYRWLDPRANSLEPTAPDDA